MSYRYQLDEFVNRIKGQLTSDWNDGEGSARLKGRTARKDTFEPMQRFSGAQERHLSCWILIQGYYSINVVHHVSL